MDMDFSCMHDVASSIMTIQETYGVIPNIYSKGECSKVGDSQVDIDNYL